MRDDQYDCFDTKTHLDSCILTTLQHNHSLLALLTTADPHQGNAMMSEERSIVSCRWRSPSLSSASTQSYFQSSLLRRFDSTDFRRNAVLPLCGLLDLHVLGLDVLEWAAGGDVVQILANHKRRALAIVHVEICGESLLTSELILPNRLQQTYLQATGCWFQGTRSR